MVGSVNTPAIYELKGKTTLAEAVKLAGGFTALTDNNKATVERVEQGDHQTFRRVEDFPLNDVGSQQGFAKWRYRSDCSDASSF